MTDTAPWIKYQQKRQVDILGAFENEYGERYVIFRHHNGDTLYFTGDEVDWGTERLWPTQFMFNDDERAKIAAILWPTFAERLQRAGAAADTPAGQRLKALVDSDGKARDQAQQREVDDLAQEVLRQAASAAVDWNPADPEASGGVSAW